MNKSVEQALFDITGKENFDQISIDDLQQVVNQHPYFPIVHLLIAKKAKQTNADLSPFILQKTALYFNNPLWLHLQLSDVSLFDFNEQNELVSEESDDTFYEVNEIGSIVPLGKGIITSQEAEAQFPSENLTEVRDEQLNKDLTDSSVLSDDQPFKEVFLEANENNDPETIEENQEDRDANEIVETEQTPESLHDPIEVIEVASTSDDSIDNLQIANEFANVETSNENVDANDNEDGQVLDVSNNDITESEHGLLLESLRSNSNENNIPSSELDVAPDPFHPEHEEVLEEIEQQKSENKTAFQSIEPTIEEHPIVIPVHDEDSKIIDEFVEAQQHPEKEVVQELPATESTSQAPLIPIEPYYTVDYFASQGIRFTPEMHPQDKLGKQLKSFTQWLKHMKKIGPEDAVKPSEELIGDPKIVGIAEKSNKKEEVVTEAMAGVLEQQGKTQQAISVYEKLSFLHPDKSAYFADKIQKLKGI